MEEDDLNSTYFLLKSSRRCQLCNRTLTFFLITFLTHFRWKIKIAKTNP